jgi:hypothetical protein
VTAIESYVERAPLPGLAGVVRTVWVQRTGATAGVHRHLLTGGVEIHFPVGGRPQLLGPLTGPEIEIIPAGTSIVGVRFWPGVAPLLATVLDDLVDQRLGVAELWESLADRTYNVSGGRPITNRELAAALQAVIPGVRPELLHGRQHGPGPDPHLDITRLTHDSGFTPAFDIAAAVADYVTWRADNAR